MSHNMQKNAVKAEVTTKSSPQGAGSKAPTRVFLKAPSNLFMSRISFHIHDHPPQVPRQSKTKRQTVRNLASDFPDGTPSDRDFTHLPAVGLGDTHWLKNGSSADHRDVLQLTFAHGNSAYMCYSPNITKPFELLDVARGVV